MDQSELETRILNLLDGQLSADEARELEAVLVADESARTTYEELALLHNALESRYAAGPAVRQMAVVPMDRLVADQQRRMVKISALTAAAILMIAGIVMVFILAPRTPVELATLRMSDGAAVAVSFIGKGDAPESDVLTKGSRVVLTQGTIESVFSSGVRLVAEAPCQLTLVEEDEVRLESGRAWFRVPPEAVGFIASTRVLRVVDLGTEFGVLSSPDDRDEVHVLDGLVEVSRKDGTIPLKLAAGSAVCLAEDGSLVEVELASSSFCRELEQKREIAVVNSSFEDDVIPRDGDVRTKTTGVDDYDKEFLPSGWKDFDDGDGGIVGTRGILSTAPDSCFNPSLSETPQLDANDQVFYTAARDIYQVLDEPLEANRTYVLTADIGDRRAPGLLGEPGNPGIRLGVGHVPGEGLLKVEHSDQPAQIDGEWVTWTVTYVTGPDPVGKGEPLRVELTTGSRVGWFDHVRLTVTP